MIDEEIHNGWEHAELRDFFARCMRDIWVLESNNGQKVAYDAIDSANLYERAYLRRKVDYSVAKKAMELAGKELAINILLTERNWKFFDVSEEVRRENSDGYTLPFIGTDEDYNYFIEKLKENEDEQ